MAVHLTAAHHGCCLDPTLPAILLHQPRSPSPWPPSARSSNKRLTAIRSGLLVARGGYWGSLRAAMNPLFHSGALHAYEPLMNDSRELR